MRLPGPSRDFERSKFQQGQSGPACRQAGEEVSMGTAIVIAGGLVMFGILTCSLQLGRIADALEAKNRAQAKGVEDKEKRDA